MKQVVFSYFFISLGLGLNFNPKPKLSFQEKASSYLFE